MLDFDYFMYLLMAREVCEFKNETIIFSKRAAHSDVKPVNGDPAIIYGVPLL